MNTSASEPILCIKNLQKSYGEFEVLRNLQLEVAAGSVHGLVGLNGSGKTTTLECVLGLQNHNGGSISILGREPEDLHLHQGRVVAIFDSPSLNPNLTVRQSLQHAALLCGQNNSRVVEMEALLGIDGFCHFKIRNLSLGNKRRASIAHGLIGNPEFVLLDEPFNGLDAGGVDDVLGLISTLNNEQGTTFLLSSHQLPYLEQVSSHFAILHEGEIVCSGSKAELLNQSDTILRIRTTDNAKTKALIAESSLASTVNQHDSEYLAITQLRAPAEQINQMLVERGIGVSEIIQQQASLDSLFRQLTDGESQ